MLQAYINNRQRNRLINYLMKRYENVPIRPNSFNQLKKNNVILFNENINIFFRHGFLQNKSLPLSALFHHNSVAAFIENIHPDYYYPNNRIIVDIRVIQQSHVKSKGMLVYLKLTREDLKKLLLYSPSPPKTPKTPNRRNNV